MLAGLARADARHGARHGPRRGDDYRARPPHARRGAAGAGVRPVLHGARDAAHPVGLFRHPRTTTTGSTRCCDSLDLAAKADANMRALSGGMKRRVLVAQALVHKPPVIVLDEPTAGVDVELRQTLWQFIAPAEPRRPHRGADHPLPGGGRGPVQPHRHAQGGRVVALDSTANLLESASSLVLRFKLDRRRAARANSPRPRITGRGVQLSGARRCASSSATWPHARRRAAGRGRRDRARPTSRTCSSRS